MRLLIAEEDAALAAFLRRGMESEGYQVQAAADGRMALEAIYAEAPDLAILDLKMNLETDRRLHVDQDSYSEARQPVHPEATVAGRTLSRTGLVQTSHLQSVQPSLPPISAAEVLRRLRASGARFPVLVLTGGADLEARLACLDQGADDCMFKPFSLQELRARCRALLRRSARASDPVFQIQDLTLNRMERVVERSGRRIRLTNREYALLEQLVLERGRLVTRATLLERVWGLSSSETNVVDVYINYLRRKLDDGGSMPLIETIRGRGYKIAVSREASPSQPSEGLLLEQGESLAR